MTKLVVFALLATIAGALMFCGPADARPPRPDPHPTVPKGKAITWVPYTYRVPSTNGIFLMECRVPVRGPRVCYVVGLLRG